MRADLPVASLFDHKGPLSVPGVWTALPGHRNDMQRLECRMGRGIGQSQPCGRHGTSQMKSDEVRPRDSRISMILLCIMDSRTG
jgi:hypothetical protein